MASPKISIDQWLTLVSVVESGSYAKAAEQLHKSQSTLTYGIQKLEELLAVKVFEIRGRRAVLTPTGELLYRRGKALVDEAARLEHTAGELAQGWEPEIRLAVEIVFPTWLLLQCLGRFGDELAPVRMVCVAAPTHPLHSLGRELTLEDLRRHRHLVIRDSGVQRSPTG